MEVNQKKHTRETGGDWQEFGNNNKFQAVINL
jgi:hypothetical protein